MYKSPLYILSELDSELPQELSTEFLLRLRKKLLAEFNLTDSPVISINGKEYSKDEVIKTIDVLLGDPQMPLHRFIFSNKKLLNFLEDDQSTVQPIDLKFIAIPEEIKPSLAPLILERLTFNLKKNFHARSFYRIIDILLYLPELPPLEHSLLEEEFNKNILSLQEHVQYVKSTGCENITTELNYLRNYSWVAFLNKLPKEFIGTIDSFVGEIINMMVFYQSNYDHDPEFLFQVSTDLCKVHCDSELMKLIRNNHVAFSQNNNQSSDKNDSFSLFSGRGVYIIIIVIIFLLRMAHSCSKSSRSSDYDFKSQTPIYTDNTPDVHIDRQNTADCFKYYREYLFQKKDETSNNATTQNASVVGGANPFKYIIKNNNEHYYTEEFLRKVIIDNKTDYDLIVIGYDTYDARAYYFFKNKQDTLRFKTDEKLCFYFGNSFSEKSLEDPQLAIVPEFMPAYESYFKDIDENTLKILKKEYSLKLKYNLSESKKVSVIKLTNDFFENDSIDNSKLILSGANYKNGKITHDNAMRNKKLIEQIINYQEKQKEKNNN